MTLRLAENRVRFWRGMGEEGRADGSESAAREKFVSMLVFMISDCDFHPRLHV